MLSEGVHWLPSFVSAAAVVILHNLESARGVYRVPSPDVL